MPVTKNLDTCQCIIHDAIHSLIKKDKQNQNIVFIDKLFVTKTIKKKEEVFTKKNQDRFFVCLFFYLPLMMSSDWEKAT